jgi:hypothetical protein
MFRQIILAALIGFSFASGLSIFTAPVAEIAD